MREAAISKLLIPWIELLCDSGDNLDLLRWVDKRRKIFFLSWIHKSSANWDTTKSDVFKQWAEYKSKLGTKDDRDFKAAFRNALRSKKNCLKLIEKGKEHRCWQILSEPIKSPKKETTNSKKKPRQKRGPKKTPKKCRPESEESFQEPRTSPSCSYAYNEEICFPSSLHQSLPPCQTLFPPPSTPSQETDVTFTDSEEQADLDCLLGSLEISTTTDYMNEQINEIPSPNIHSSPQSPAQISLSESSYGVPSPNAYSNTQSPAQRSMNAPINEDSSPNAYTRLLSPAQRSASEQLYGILSPYVDSTPSSPAQRSVSETTYRISSSNVFLNPQSPAQKSMNETIHNYSSPNIYSSPQSPAQRSVIEPLSGIPSPYVYSSPLSPVQAFSGDEALFSACNSPVSFSNAVTGWMSPEQRVPVDDVVNLLNVVSEVEPFRYENKTQGFLKPLYQADYERNKEHAPCYEELESHQNFYETFVQIEQPNQQVEVVYVTTNDYNSSLMEYSERQLLEQFADLGSENNEFARHQL